MTNYITYRISIICNPTNKMIRALGKNILSIPRRSLHCNTALLKERKFNQPLPEDVVPEYGGIASMIRLPIQQGNPQGLDACFVGIPMDHGTSWRSGTRHGPASIRQHSSLIGPYSRVTGAAPFQSMQVADIGDAPVNPFDLRKALNNITGFYDKILQENCIPLGMGGDHTLSLAVMRSLHKKYGPVGMIHVDAHCDVNDTMFGEKIAHGTPMRRAVEEGLVNPQYVVQIGLRGGGYGPDDYKWPREQVNNIMSYCNSIKTCSIRAFVWYWLKTAGTNHLSH